MKLFNLVGCTLLATQAAGRFLPKSQSLGDDPSRFDSKTIDKTSTVPEFAGDPDTKPNPDPNSDEEDDVVKVWNKALCSGQKIFMAMTSPSDQTHKFITPPQSPWSGTLVKELEAWGWNDLEDERDYMCDFDGYQNLKTAFKALDIDTRSVDQKGPNQCFHIEHDSSPITERPPGGVMPPLMKQTYIGPDGKRYRATSAYATIGVNPKSGVLYFVHRKAPHTAASELWKDRPRDEDFDLVDVTSDQLPTLRASSDIAWGFWNRGSAQDIKNIQKIMSLTVINDDTLAIIKKALKKWEPPEGQKKPTEVPPWPGITFVLDGDNEGLAILGSPNGVAAGYFLAQHKKELGEKLISKITVFRPDTAESLPTLLFWVADAPEKDDDKKKDDPKNVDPDLEMEGTVVKRSKDGMDIVREHVFRARL